MKSLTQVVVRVAAAMLLAWHGTMLSIPHTHADSSVPREIISCSASQPSSPVNHLHASGRLLVAHACLACLAGSSVAHAPGVENVAAAAAFGPLKAVKQPGLRSRVPTHLPLLRGPPVAT